MKNTLREDGFRNKCVKHSPVVWSITKASVCQKRNKKMERDCCWGMLMIY